MSDSESEPAHIETGVLEAEIMARALQFARTFAFVNHRVLSCADARDEIVARFGTPDSTRYREIRIHMDWPPEKFALIESANASERAALQSFLTAGVELLVVCSRSDIIYNEFVGWDFD